MTILVTLHFSRRYGDVIPSLKEKRKYTQKNYHYQIKNISKIVQIFFPAPETMEFVTCVFRGGRPAWIQSMSLSLQAGLNH